MKFSKFFSQLQEAPWYRAFLNPVIDEIGTKGKLLDIGTGSGKLLQILVEEKGIECVGVDTNSDMLAEAASKLKNTKVELVEITPNEKLPFADNTFAYISICSVLFHMKKEDIDKMLDDSRQLLKEKGKIIVLTPTGGGSILKLTRHFFSLKNRGAYVWYRATKKRARRWTEENHLAEYAKKHQLKYKREFVMHGFVQLEVIYK